MSQSDEERDRSQPRQLNPEIRRAWSLIQDARITEARAAAEQAFQSELAKGPSWNAALLGEMVAMCSLQLDDVDGALAWVDKVAQLARDAADPALRFWGPAHLARSLCVFLAVEAGQDDRMAPGMHLTWRLPDMPPPVSDQGFRARKHEVAAAVANLISMVRSNTADLHDKVLRGMADQLQVQLDHDTLPPDRFLEKTSDTSSPQGRCWRAGVYHLRGQYEKALAEVDRALELDAKGPFQLTPQQRLGMRIARYTYLRGLGREEEARAVYNDLKTYPMSVEDLDAKERQQLEEMLKFLDSEVNQRQPSSAKEAWGTCLQPLLEKVDKALDALAGARSVVDMVERADTLEEACDNFLDWTCHIGDIGMRTKSALWALEVARMPVFFWRQTARQLSGGNLHRASHAARVRRLVHLPSSTQRAKTIQVAVSLPKMESKVAAPYCYDRISEALCVPQSILSDFPKLPEPHWLVINFAFTGPTLTAYPIISTSEGNDLPYVPCCFGAVREDLWNACRQLRLLGEGQASGRVSVHECEAKCIDWLHAISEILELDDMFDLIRNDRKAGLSLCIIPDGPLHLVPWPVLFDASGAHLFQVYRDVFTCPSLAVVKDQMASAHAIVRNGVDMCYFAAPGPVNFTPEGDVAEFGTCDRRYLSATAEEYSSLKEILGAGRLYAFGNAEPPNATIANFRTYHNAAAITAFSGHGYSCGEEVGIELTDGSLSWGEILSDPRWNFFGSELVYLNGCFLGQETPVGRDAFGLKSTLVRKGVKRVVSGLYPLADEAAAEFASLFMKRFVPYLSARKPHPAANAMKEAMSEMSSMSEFS
ncbi:MAG TPA: CHAT domain-containing protein, partial [Acidobacteriota bacterium]|nr:CHAT domain-containing protein [Acidobacteriota bacterium]